VRKIIQLRGKILLLLTTFLCGKLFGLTGPFYQEGPVKMALVLPASGVAPNSTTWIGWWIQREEGWHTYWEHPGNVGITPHLEWTLPNDHTVSILQYPFPKRVQMAGVKAYGHYDETLYLAQLQVPALLEGSMVELSAKAVWMACSNVCLPQNGELSIRLPVQSSPELDPVWDARFQDFLKHRPESVPQSWELQAKEIGQFTKLSVSNAPLSEADEVYLFGGDYLVCSDAEQRLRSTSSGFELLVPKPVWPKENPTHLHGLLRVSNGASSTRHYPIQVPLD
jgi:DsbC/DsbD-like thiol-disulfide interchange protein